MTQLGKWRPWLPRAVFDPLTIMAGSGLALSAIGTVTSAGAQLQQGRAANEAGKAQAAADQYQAAQTATIDRYRADIADYSASIDEQTAQRYESEASAQADIIGRATARALGAATAAFGASGVSGGSTLAVLHDQATEGALQKNLALYGGATAAAGARAQGVLDSAQANIYRAVATQTQAVGNYQASAAIAGGSAIDAASQTGAGATLLTGLGRTALGGYNLATSGNPTIPTVPRTGNSFPQGTATQHF